MKRNKKWKKIVQTAILLVLVTVLACPLPAIAQTVNDVNEKSEVAEEKDSNTKTEPQEDTQTENNVEEDPEATEEKDSNTEDPQPVTPQIKNAVNGMPRAAKANNNDTDDKIQALIQALGGSEFAERDSSYIVKLKKDATVSSGTLTIPQGVILEVNGKILTVGASVTFVIENGGRVVLENDSFMKVDCAISGTESSILLDVGSSISALSSLEKFEEWFIRPILPTDQRGKVVNCTDLKEERTVYAPVILTEREEAESFIIKPDGRGMAYESLGWNKNSSFYNSEAGDMIYLLKDFVTTDDEENYLIYGINCPLKAGVTFVIKRDQTFSIGILSLMCMAGDTDAGKGEGSILALAGSRFRMPLNGEKVNGQIKRHLFVGDDDEALVRLDLGSFKLQLPQYPVSPRMLFSTTRKAVPKADGSQPSQALLTQGSKGVVQHDVYLRTMNDAMDCTVEENAQLTIKAGLILHGNAEPYDGKSPSTLTMEDGSIIQTQENGFLFLDARTKTLLKSGASLAAGPIDGDKAISNIDDGPKSYFQGGVTLEANAALSLQDEKLIGGPDAYISVTNGTVDVNLHPDNQLKLTENSEAVLNKDWIFGLTSKNYPNNNYLKDLTIENNSTFTLNATLTIPAGATLNLDGTLVIGPNGKLILENGSTLNNNGNINVQPGGEVSGGSSFKLTPFQNKDFRAEQEGYTSPETLDVAVESNGTQPTGNLTASLSGSNADSFSLTPSGDLGSLSPNDAPKNFTVSPKTGLKEGTYTAEITVSNDQISATFLVSFTVKKGSSGGDTPGTDDPNANTNSKPASSKVQPTPNTGDNSPVMSWAVLMMLSLIVGSTTFWGYRRKKREIR